MKLTTSHSEKNSMKILSSLTPILLLGLALPMPSATADGVGKKNQPSSSVADGRKSHGKSVIPYNDSADDYNHGSEISDPLEPLNRVTFWANDQIYTFLLRPLSKTYEHVVPLRARKGVYNFFDHLEYPVRFVNDGLQLKFARAGQETEKFLINTIGGVGGFVRLSDRIPSLTDVPRADTGQTLAKWGIGHGFYLVLPVLGPRSLRDTVGLAGDYALYPVTWVSIYFVDYSWTLAFSTPDTARNLHEKLSSYDLITRHAVDRYEAIRSAYSQTRKQAAQKSELTP